MPRYPTLEEKLAKVFRAGEPDMARKLDLADKLESAASEMELKSSSFNELAAFFRKDALTEQDDKDVRALLRSADSFTSRVARFWREHPRLNQLDSRAGE